MFATFFPPYNFGGDGVGIQRMARALAARGHRVTVVHDADAYLNLGGKLPADTADEPGIRRIGLKSAHGLVSDLLVQQLGRPVFHAAEIERIAESEPWDIVWYNNASLIGGPRLFSYGPRNGSALKVYEAHEHWLVCPMHVLWRNGRELCDERQCLKCTLTHKRPPQLWRYTGLLDRQLDLIDLLVAKSAFSAAKHREFGLRQDMTVLPYFLPDLDHAVTPPFTGHPRPYFLFVGRLEKIKGLQDVFPAMDHVNGADLLILGDGDYRAELERLAAGNPRIRFLGRLPSDELNAYYRGAEALIVPSVCYETFGIILIESFRLGTPVIARKLGPFPEIIESSGGGKLFTEEADMIAAMRFFLQPSAERAGMSRAARTGFEAHWRENVVMAQWGAELARAAHASGRAELARVLDAGAFEHGMAMA
jgi:glycosyltransferase involved in cell wall biosynthesis